MHQKGGSIDLMYRRTLIKNKEKNFFLYYEIQKGAVSKPYITNGLLINA
jgi:hypothetical protein